MRYNIEGGSLPVLVCSLEPGEAMISESGGRSWAKGNIVTETTSNGGAGKALGRLLTGESLFLSKYTANSQADIAFSSSFPGKIIPFQLAPGQSIVCQKKAFLAGTFGVTMEVFFNKSIGKGLFGGEGFLMQKFTGPGVVFLEIDGHCTEHTLAPGERIVCDTGVIAAMDETCTMNVEMVKGVKNMLFGGEGLFDTIVTGPGKVYLQSMTISQLAGLVSPYITTKK